MRTLRFAAAGASLFVVLAGTGTAMASPAADRPATGTLVTVGSPVSPFSQNKQNEPAVAIDANHPSVVVAGANDNIDMEACNAGDPTTCPFTQGVGVSGVYFSFNGGQTWTQPTYSGWSARNCLGPAACAPHTGPIGTLPHYVENGLVSGGDPAVAFGPRPGANGTFSWANGSRLYYANLTSNFATTKRDETFKGFEAIAVSRTDNPQAAAANNASAWMDPVLISKQSSTTFSDKEQVWADNAQSSPFFGNVYVCWASFRGQEKGNAAPVPLIVARSADGGSTWTQKQVGPATSNGVNSQPDGCTVRTDSHGNLYVFGVGSRGGTSFEMMYKSTDGGAHFTGPALLSTAVNPGVFDPVIGRPVMDGIAGARNDLAFAPSADIANGAPTGAGATNRIVLTWADGSKGLNHEQLLLMTSTNGGASFTAPAISPNGTDVYITYNAFTTPYRTDTSSPRGLVGVILHADVTGGTIGAFGALARGAVGVWNDVRNGKDCPALDAWRLSLRTDTSVPKPAPQADCPAAFGNSDIFGAAVSDPTP